MIGNFFLIDVSKYQPPDRLDYVELRAGGVVGGIAKASQGAYGRDPTFPIHIERMIAAGMIPGAYHWCDPIFSPEQNLSNFLLAIAGLPVRVLAVDVEQYWADWAEWRLAIQGKGKITRIIPPLRISDCARRMVDNLEKTDIGRATRTLVYTRKSFVRSWARPMSAWLPRYDLWPAHYPYSLAAVKTTWAEMKTRWKPKIAGPLLPDGCKAWRLWQFSGDKFILPGTGGRVIDLNLYNGSEEDFRRWAGVEIAEKTGEDSLSLGG